MTTGPAPFTRRCPQCGADLGASTAPACWLCGHYVGHGKVVPGVVRREDPNPYAPPRAEIATGRTSRIATLLLVIAVIAVILGVLREVPPLGVVLAVISVPAVIRTGVASRRLPATPGVFAQVGLFLSSFTVAAVTLVSAVIAFGITCFPLGLITFRSGNGSAVILAFLAGFAASGYVVWVLARKIWPVRGDLP